MHEHATHGDPRKTTEVVAPAVVAAGWRTCRRLLLARHGAAEGNDRGIRLGFDEPLLPAGEEQARALAGQVQELGVTEIWSSPSPRAWRTATIVADRLALPVHPDLDLREIEEGPWVGMTEQEIARAFPREHAAWQRDPGSVELPGREGLRRARRRVAAVLDRLLDRPGTVLAVTHSGPIRLAWVHFNGLPLDSFGVLQPSNCGLFCLRGVEPDWELSELDGDAN
ncbi:MAG: histidine phosphatase family protein [Thermoanaerobaculia bacterium]